MAETIGWSSLPNIPRAVIDFVAGRPDVVALLGGDYRKKETLRAVRDRRLSASRPAGVGSALRAGYGDLPMSPALEANLAALDRPDTLAIVTGQQIGLFGGPLFTFYKALHAVLLAAKLSAEAPGAVVPIFWMETADADFGEVNRAAFPPAGSEPRRVVYTPQDMVVGRSVSLHSLSPEILESRNLVLDWIRELPFGRQVGDLLERTYSPGREMSGAFRELMNELLGEFGLVFADARHPAIRSLTKEFWELALRRPESLNHAFVKASRDLASTNLPLQVQLRHDALPVLEIGDDGVRRRILGESGNWWIGIGEPFGDDELQRIAAERYERLTPSALLRPLLQDWLFPTWIYVGGPAEVAYHAQVGACFDLLEIPRPLISPRMSLTLVERPARRWLEKNGWSVADVIGGREILLARSGRAESLRELFDNGAEHFQSWLTRIEKAGDESGINIFEEIDQAGRKISFQWDKLRASAINRLAEQDRTRVSHAEKLLDRIVPDGMLQERHNSVFYFLASYGGELVRKIRSEVDLMTPQHLAIDVGSAGD